MVKKVSRTSPLRASIDRRSDVLYLSLGHPSPDEGEDGPCGTILRFSTEDDHPTGVTVVGFSEQGWENKPSKLIEIVSNHLHASEAEVLAAINAAKILPSG